jgi:hypothetical protein
MRKEDQGDGTYGFVVSGYIVYKDTNGKERRKLPIIGRCYSDDQFMYAKKEKELKKLHGINWDKPLPEDVKVVIKERDVMDKATANWISRAVSVMAGLKYPTQEMFLKVMQKYPSALLNPAKFTEVDFQEGKDTAEKKDERAAASGGASKDAIKELRETVTAVSKITGEVPADILKRCSYFKADDGKEVWAKSFSSVSASWAPKILEKAKKELEQLDNPGQEDIPLPEEEGK